MEPSALTSASLTLAIEGMGCRSCVTKIEQALAKLPGLEAATVDHANKQAHVRFDPGAVSPAEIAQAILALDYGVTILAKGAQT
ncbi:MAG TPA: heavy metal-associated domain-containing protein [Pantanalinema sp.]